MNRLLALGVLIALIAVPLATRPASPTAGETLVIITPHGEPIRAEFARAFSAWYQRQHGRTVQVDWRTPGGTSDIRRFLDGTYRSRFREQFPAHAAAARIFAAAKPPADATEQELAAYPAARAAFLASDITTGIDLFFGGGEFPYSQMAAQGYLVDAGLLNREPQWFTEAVIPQSLSGETVYDRQGRYYGACLSVFGIAWSPDRLRDLRLSPPSQWRDLADPAYFRQLTLADPTKSGAVVTTLERMLQQCMAEAANGDLAAGWADGWLMIKTLVANSRWITDSASKPTRDTARGDCLASTAIDFQAKLEQEYARHESGGGERLGFVVPVGGTSVSADPIALLRGAPQRELAIAFIHFVLSSEGQRLWNYRVGTPGGPSRWCLRRLSVRRDVLDADWRRYAGDPDADPFALAQTFTYRPGWTGKAYNLIGPLTKAIGLDVRDELQAAWQAIISAGGPTRVPEAWAEFSWLPVPYAEVAATRERLAEPTTAVPLLRAWTSEAQQRYRRARALAEAGR